MNRIIFFLLFFISCSRNSHVDIANEPIAKIASFQNSVNGLPVKFGNFSEYADDSKNSDNRQHEWTINLNKNLVTILGFELISEPFLFPGIKTNSTYQSFEVIDWTQFINHFGIALLNDGDEICISLRVLNADGIQSGKSNEVCGIYNLIAIAPITAPDTVTSTYNTPVTTNVLLNDSDPNNNLNPNSVTIVTNSNPLTEGSCSITGVSPNQILFTPVTGFTGTATCIYQVCDTTSLCSPALLSIIIGPPGAPIANMDTASSPYNTAVTTNITSNDTDPNNDINTNSVTIIANTNTLTQGSCTITGSSPNQILFTPVAGFTGIATCTYQVCDATSLCASANLNITLINGASPILLADSENGTNQSVTIADVLVNDSDPDSNLPSYNDLNLSSLAITSNANTTTEGSCSVVAGKINFTPISSFIGTATCTYEVCDKQTPTPNCSTANVDFVISAVPFSGLFIGASTNNVADTGGFTATAMNTYLTASGVSSYETMNGFSVGTGNTNISNTINGITYTIRHYDENAAAPIGSLRIGTQRNFSVTNPVSQGTAAGTTIGIESVGGSITSRNSFLFSFSSPVGYFSIDALDLESNLSFTFGTIILYDASNNIIASSNIDYVSDDGNNLIHFIGYVSSSANISHVQIIVGDDGAGGGNSEQIAIDNLRFGTKTGIYP